MQTKRIGPAVTMVLAILSGLTVDPLRAADKNKVLRMSGLYFDAVLVLATAFAAVFVSVDMSILIGVGLSILMFAPRASKVSMHE